MKESLVPFGLLALCLVGVLVYHQNLDFVLAFIAAMVFVVGGMAVVILTKIQTILKILEIEMEEAHGIEE